MVYSILSSQNRSDGAFALLIDPDKQTIKGIEALCMQAQNAGVDILLLGGSLVTKSIEKALDAIKGSTPIPVVLFPGDATHFCSGADAILLLSLISGRNADYLIGNHIHVANAIKDSNMEVIPTGYMLIESGAATSVQYISNTMPIPSSKTEIAVATALAGQQLGLKAIYLEAGSGAIRPVPKELISEVKKRIDIPIIVGGGLRSPQQVKEARKAGASMVVVGNIIEDSPDILLELVQASR